MNPSGVPEVKSHVTDEVLVQRRRGQIVAAAVELFAHQGYYRTTIQEIAKLAGVSSGLIYQYVSDKEDVLLLAVLSVLDSYKREIPAAMEGFAHPLERYRAALDAYCRVVDTRREATVLAYRSTKSLPEERRRLIKDHELETNGLIAGCLRECIAEGLIRDIDVDLITYQLVTFAHSWALKHWRLKTLCTLEEYIDQGLDFFAHALFTPKGWRHYRKIIAAGPTRGAVAALEAAKAAAAEKSRRTKRASR
jgi:AcrR family transcriptional regulator